MCVYGHFTFAPNNSRNKNVNFFLSNSIEVAIFYRGNRRIYLSQWMGQAECQRLSSGVYRKFYEFLNRQLKTNTGKTIAQKIQTDHGETVLCDDKLEEFINAQETKLKQLFNVQLSSTVHYSLPFFYLMSWMLLGAEGICQSIQISWNNSHQDLLLKSSTLVGLLIPSLVLLCIALIAQTTLQNQNNRPNKSFALSKTKKFSRFLSIFFIGVNIFYLAKYEIPDQLRHPLKYKEIIPAIVLTAIAFLLLTISFVNSSRPHENTNISNDKMDTRTP